MNSATYFLRPNAPILRFTYVDVPNGTAQWLLEWTAARDYQFGYPERALTFYAQVGMKAWELHDWYNLEEFFEQEKAGSPKICRKGTSLGISGTYETPGHYYAVLTWPSGVESRYSDLQFIPLPTWQDPEEVPN